MTKHSNIGELYRRTRALAAEMDIKIASSSSAVIQEVPELFAHVTAPHRHTQTDPTTIAILAKPRPVNTERALQFHIDKEFKHV